MTSRKMATLFAVVACVGFMMLILPRKFTTSSAEFAQSATVPAPRAPTPTTPVMPADNAVTSADLSSLHSALRKHFDSSRPGRGVTDYPGNTVDDVPKAYAMVLKAELEWSGKVGVPVSDLAIASGRFLLDHHDERGDGFPGWGVPIAWDPYGDGSVNPAHTKYTISTAIVIDALLDWMEFDPTAPREQIISLSSKAVEPYLREEVLSPSGLLPYSLEVVDRPYDTFNPAAYLAGTMQRLSHYVVDEKLRDALRAVADRTVQAHLDHHQLTTDGTWYWHYSITEKVPNDLAHAGYIIYGLRAYAQYGGRLANKLDLPAIERHLRDFLGHSMYPLVAWPVFRTDANTPARAYDLGLGLHLSCVMGKRDLALGYAQALPLYRTAEGSYLKYPPSFNAPRLNVREYESYVLLGLASCLEKP